MTIRIATTGDAAVIASIHASSLPFVWSEKAIRQLIKNKYSTLLLAENEDGVVIGYVSARYVIDAYELLNIAVVAEYRRMGVGRALIQSLLSALAQDSACHIYLEVRQSNDRAKNLYESMGFTLLTKRDKYYMDTGESAYVMVYKATS